MRCKDCGAENPAGNRFCGMCGAPLVSDRRADLQANGYFSDRHGDESAQKVEFAAPDSRETPDGIETEAPSAEARPSGARAASDRLSDARDVGPRVLNGHLPQSREREVAAPDTFVVKSQRRVELPEDERLTVDDHRNAAAIPVSRPENEREAVRERVREREREEAPIGHSVAPSMFGLGEARPVVFSSQGDDGSYLLEEPHRTVSWRAWLLLVIVVGLGYLGWRQWYAVHYPGHPDLAKVLQQDTKPSAENAQNDPTGPAVNKPESDAAGQHPSSTAAAPTDNANSATGTASNTAGPAAAPNASGAASNSNASTAAPDVSSTGPKAAAGTPPATSAPTAAESKADTQTDDEDAADTPDVPAKPTTRSNATPSRSAAAAAPATPNYDTDPMLVRAQQYLHAHPPNCDLGVTYLQTAAESNPKARIQMAALYASGVCVRQDRAEAYKWFSRAQDLDPHNSWLERNRVRLWAEMSPDERARAH